MPLFASLDAHFSLDRKPVRGYIRWSFTVRVYSGFLGAGNTALTLPQMGNLREIVQHEGAVEVRKCVLDLKYPEAFASGEV